jgi:serine-type D-Ala-D-Ala carboxypeptidase
METIEPLPVPQALPFLHNLAHHIAADLCVAPCAVIAAAGRKNNGWVQGIGCAGSLFPDGPLASTTTVFDLASVTKPFTALTCLRLHHAGKLSLFQPLSELYPLLSSTPLAKTSLELLLAHRAGLDGHRPLYAPLLQNQPIDRNQALLTAAHALRSDCLSPLPAQGFPPEYSDLGYLLAGACLEHVTQTPLDTLISAEVSHFVGCHVHAAHQFGPDTSHVAPTEFAEFRGGIVCGHVHDENAWALGNTSVCGHAGLFGTAQDILHLGIRLLEVLADQVPAWLDSQQLSMLLKPRPGGTLLAGFDGKSGTNSSAGTLFGPQTFGHLGFTGTSLWIDPEQQWVGVLLTNRVHPTRENQTIRSVRPLVYDAVARWAQALSD